MKKGIYTRNGVDYEFEFKTSLKVSEKIMFVNAVIDTIIIDNTFYSFLKDLMFDFEVIKIFTDVYPTESKIDDIEVLLSETNIVEIVCANVPDIIRELKNAVNDNIQYRTGIKQNNVEDAIVHLIKTVEHTFDGIDAKVLMDYAQKISSVVGELNADKIVNAYTESDAYKQHLIDADKKAEQRTEAFKEFAKVIKKK